LVRGASELVDQVAFRAHHLDAVVAGLARQAGARGEVAIVRSTPRAAERARA
jgi:hypothetical protein